MQQDADSSLRALVASDHADVITRGFIEGYYGNPWSTRDRVALMEWGGYYKLNAYIYAPKDDPKHNSQWREKYTQAEIDEKIKPLAEAGNKSKVRFVYALHPFMHNPITKDNYDETFEIMKAKFLQVIDAGTRQIAILADDAGYQLVHPFMHNPITKDNYDETFEIMKAKFLQVIDAGTRQIAILADDAGYQLSPKESADLHSGEIY